MRICHPVLALWPGLKHVCRQGSRVLVTLGLIAVLSSWASAQDDSVWINQGIQNAIANGQPVYTIPAGNYVLANPIVIPPGTHNFTLQGAGSALTHLSAPNTQLAFPGYAILVGQQVLLNNWNLTNCETGDTIANVKTGDRTVIVTSNNGSYSSGQYAVILDQNQVYTSAPGVNQGQYNRAELTKLTAATPKGTLTLDTTAAREYDDSPMIYTCSDTVSTKIAVTGMSFDGTIQGQTIRNNGIVNACLVDGLNLSDLAINNYQDRAIQTDIVRNGTFTALNIQNGADIQDEGNGYGLTMCRSRSIMVVNGYANSTRHSFTCTNGSTDITFTNCNSVVMNYGLNDFNTHGFDERRVHYNNCKGTLTFGNPSWLGGCEGFTVNSCQSTQALYLGPNASNISLTNSTIGPVNFVYVTGGHGTPSSGYATGINFYNCSFPEIWAIGKALTQLGTASFSNCTFENTTATWGSSIIIPLNAVGNLSFSSCQFINDSTRPGDLPIELGGGSQFQTTLTNCSLYSYSGATGAVLLQSGPQYVTATHNNFYSLNPKSALNFFQGSANGGNLVGTYNATSKIVSWPF